MILYRGFYLVSHSIANNIDMAIKACTPEKSNLLKNREEMQMVKESLDEGYCDVTGKTMDLGLAGTFSLHRVFSCHLTTSNPQVAWVV